MENVSATRMYRVFEIDTDVLYQWRTIVPTFETSITKIRNICIKNATAEHSDAVYELRGDEREPIDGITIENVHVNKLHRFISNTEYVKNLTVKDITWDEFDPSTLEVSVSGFVPGR